MSKASSIRNAHFLGTKIRNLRKRNNLTMDDLSARCVKLDAESAPSVSYISMIERGKRHPSEQMLTVIAEVFQKEVPWFLDNVPEEAAIAPDKGSRGGVTGMSLEPGFLFSKEILQNAIPEMLSQTGVSGRQFAHLLIRAHQENNQNHFPELERAAENVGKKQMPLSVEALMNICANMGLKIKWFTRLPQPAQSKMTVSDSGIVRSYFDAPATIYVNKLMQKQPERLKYDLALYIGHKVLHEGDGVKSLMTTGPQAEESVNNIVLGLNASSALNAQDIVHAWRDFECSFFAGALLCPKVPFRRLLEQKAHDISVAKMVGVTTSTVMRRMTVVSSYSHWHYFDAYPPGRLHAVYRGNGIPLPWGNMRLVQDPCQHWAVFRMINAEGNTSSAQISVLDVGDEPRIYCCESVKVTDMSGTGHVLCAGIDVNPALTAQGADALAIAQALKDACITNGGSVTIPPDIKTELRQIAKLLNIAWLERGIEKEARLICPRSGACPRSPSCHKKSAGMV
ncbi:MAG: transcriptional regulator with XRE-family HTH domain/Zn-dependent peptidase ImmA (M78 family) [Porticoccaceae bacterium]|jgi:transcriptional regulator with XRE-family HTH domain/Zn-dependent peptidase ImmA (M78 family)